MGYLLSSLGNLPVEENIELYIFIIDGSWHGGTIEKINANFENIAKQIGPKAVIAKGFEEGLWTNEVCEKYLGKDYSHLYNLLPAILITDNHPDHLTETSARILVPLKGIEERFEDLDYFFNSLSRFARFGDKSFLEKIKNENDLLTNANQIIDLKPNFFGIGINLNALIKKFRK